MSDIKKLLTGEISTFIKNTDPDTWKDPLVGFADIYSPYIRNLREYTVSEHQMPEDVMPDATVMLVYFLPFRDELVKSNHGSGLASAEWARIYEETNSMFPKLNDHLTEVIRSLGYDAAQSPEASAFYRDELISHWSFRHFAYAAELGTFGLNNMLITENGCAGRINGLVTNLDVTAGKPQTEEACLYKRSGKCGLCMKVCPVRALTPESYDRRKCYAQCLKNAAIHTSFGSSYGGDGSTDVGSEVCGKCIAGMPCALRRP